MNYLWKNKFNILLVGFFLLLFCFRLHNAINFNSYWGYDGGAHLEYIKTVMQDWRLPTMAENYLAWHEPGFYFFNALLGWATQPICQTNFLDCTIKFLQTISAFLSLLFVFLVYKTAQKFSSDKKVWLAAVIGGSLISVMTETTNYLTNELLAAFLTTLLIYYFIIFSQKGWNTKRIILMSVLSGAALLTKLSAVIFVLALLVWFIYKACYERKIKWLGYSLLFLVIAGGIYAPWIFYKQKHFGNGLSINIYEEQINAKGNLSKNFFLHVSGEIFRQPFWMSSKDSFFSVVFADAFSDYYTIANHVDKNNLEVPDSQKVLTESGNLVTVKKFQLSILLLYFSLFFVFIFIAGVLGLFWRWIKSGFRPNINLFFLIFISSSFLALAFNVYKFPFLERGTLKASFILSTWPLLMIVGWAWLSMVLKKIKGNFLWLPLGFMMAVWAGLSFAINWI
ncbi:MAG TPA: glycosyltransferase family 39 protein [bacterium]|nr:glycosyltransferase family 39 protein [bacterium]